MTKRSPMLLKASRKQKRPLHRICPPPRAGVCPKRGSACAVDLAERLMLRPDKNLCKDVTSLLSVARPDDPGPPEKTHVKRVAALVDDAIVLGAGTYGVMYRLRYKGALVAAKLIHDNLAAVKQAQHALDLMKLLQARTDSTAFARYGTLLTDGQRWIQLMQFIPGVNMETFIETGGTTIAARTYDTVARSALRGLAAMHAAGIAHRDINPSNIIMRNNFGDDMPVNDVVFIDFDFACTADKSGAGACPQTASGTRMYVAPERRRGLYEIDPLPSDIYSLGVVFAELLDMHRHRGHGLITEGTEKQRSLIYAMTDNDPVRRPTAREALLRV